MNNKTLKIPFLLTFMTIYLIACTNQSEQAISPSSPAALETLDIGTINPSNRVVALSELDLKPTTRILVYDPKAEKVLSISGKSTELVPNIKSGLNAISDGVKMSPDHRWFAYLDINEGFNIRVSSVDGNQDFIGIKNAVGSSFRWLNNETIAVYDKVGFWLDCPSEMQIINPFSGDVNVVTDISTQGSQYCFPIPLFNSDFSQALYLNSQTGWEMYNYDAHSSYSVLLGLDTSPGGDKYFFNWGVDGVSFAIPDLDKITYAFDIPEPELASELHLNTISLPNGAVNKNEIIEYWIPDEQIVGLELFGSDNETLLDCDISQSFVVINLATLKLNNYCLTHI